MHRVRWYGLGIMAHVTIQNRVHRLTNVFWNKRFRKKELDEHTKKIDVEKKIIPCVTNSIDLIQLVPQLSWNGIPFWASYHGRCKMYVKHLSRCSMQYALGDFIIIFGKIENYCTVFLATKLHLDEPMCKLEKLLYIAMYEQYSAKITFRKER